MCYTVVRLKTSLCQRVQETQLQQIRCAFFDGHNSGENTPLKQQLDWHKTHQSVDLQCTWAAALCQINRVDCLGHWWFVANNCEVIIEIRNREVRFQHATALCRESDPLTPNCPICQWWTLIRPSTLRVHDCAAAVDLLFLASIWRQQLPS